MKRAGFTIICCLMLLFLLLLPTACFVDDEQQNQTSTLVSQVKELQKWQAEVGNQISDAKEEATKSKNAANLNTNSIAAAEKRVASLEDDVKELKDDLAALTKKYNSLTTTTNPTTTTVPTSTTGQVTFTTDPVAPQLLGSNLQYCFTMKIVNGTSQWRYIKPIMTLTTTSVVDITAFTLSYTGSGVNLATTNISVSPAVPTTTATASLIAIPISGGNSNLGEYQIAAGYTLDVLVCMSLETSAPQVWNISMSISDRGI